MNKYVILLCLFFVAYINTFTSQPILKLYMQNDTEIVYHIEDIQEFKIVKTKNPSYFNIYYNDTNNYKRNLKLITSEIDSVNFKNNNFIISTTRGLLMYEYAAIDSIIIEQDSTSLGFDTVTICEQVWMKKNLNVTYYRNGDLIRHAQTDEEWIDAYNKSEGAWCYYNNDPANEDLYGKLYNWFAVYDPRNLAPVGWHIPNMDEWKELKNCLGGYLVAGGKLKSTGTIENGDGLWHYPNAGATNESGFSALPGGWRSQSGSFTHIGNFGYWWFSKDSVDLQSWNRYLYYGTSSLYLGNFHIASGFSVRCIMD